VWVYQFIKGKVTQWNVYTGIKLLEHAMKVVEMIFEHRIRQRVEIDDVHFAFMKGKGTTDAIFTTRAMLCAVYAMVVCLSVCVSVCVRHKSVFY